MWVYNTWNITEKKPPESWINTNNDRITIPASENNRVIRVSVNIFLNLDFSNTMQKIAPIFLSEKMRLL